MEKSLDNKEIWDRFYKKSSKYIYWPSEDIFTFAEKYLGNVRGKNVLDIGCGAGRHLLLFGHKGANTFGIDSSKEAIGTSKRFLKEFKINSEIKLGNSTKIPYKDNFFDIIILWGIFHYLSPEDQQKTIKEVIRVSKNGAWVIFSLRSKNDSRYGLGKQIRRNTFLQDKPGKKSIVIEYWDKKRAENFLRLDNLLIGEKIVAPIGRYETKSAHWILAGKIKK